jgi:hypothetical protein
MGLNLVGQKYSICDLRISQARSPLTPFIQRCPMSAALAIGNPGHGNPGHPCNSRLYRRYRALVACTGFCRSAGDFFGRKSRVRSSRKRQNRVISKFHPCQASRRLAIGQNRTAAGLFDPPNPGHTLFVEPRAPVQSGPKADFQLLSSLTGCC